MSEPVVLPLEVQQARQAAAEARLERDLVLRLAEAQVSDVEAALLLVKARLGPVSAEAPPEAAAQHAAIAEVLQRRPHLQARPPALPGPLPSVPSEPGSVPPTRAQALAKAQSGHPADLAEYLRQRRAQPS